MLQVVCIAVKRLAKGLKQFHSSLSLNVFFTFCWTLSLRYRGCIANTGVRPRGLRLLITITKKPSVNDNTDTANGLLESDERNT